MSRKIFALFFAFLLVFSVGCAAKSTPQTRLTVVGTSTAASSSAGAPIHTTAASSPTAASTQTAASSGDSSAASTTTAPQTSLSAATTYTTTSMQAIRYQDVEARFSAMTTEEKVGQLFFVSVEGRDTLTEADQALLRDCAIGNIILFTRNIDHTAQLASLNTEILDAVSANTGICPFIGVDQEGGPVMRIFDACLAPPAMAVGATGDPALARSLGELMGAQLRTLGINVNFAPCADVNSNPDNPVIGDRSYSEDASTAAAFVSATVEGLQSSGVLACVKHFPGHGDTAEDSHISLPSVSYDLNRLNQVELVPFRAGIAANVAMTMVGHILYPALGAQDVPASLSQPVIDGFLRGELKFKGLVITDSLSMGAITNTYGVGEACVMALTAGADLLCINDNADAIREAYAAVLQAVKDGRISEDRLNDSVLRILNTKYEYGILSGSRPSDQLPDTAKYAALLSTIAEKSLTLLAGQAAGIPDVSSTLVLSTVPLRDAQVRETQNLGAYLTRNYGCNAMDIERSPTTIQLASALSTAKLYSTVILSVSGTGNIDLAARIAQLGVTLIIVVMDDPYTAASYVGLGADAVFCAYENTDYSIRAVADRLMGADS